MSLEGVINTVPTRPDIEFETYHDNRVKVYLLYKDKKRSDFLIVPFGVDIKGKKDITYYLRFFNNGSAISHSWFDASIEENFLKDGGKYFSIDHKTDPAVLPFKTYKEFPSKIMPNNFTKRLVDCNEEVLKKFVEFFNYSYNLSNKYSVTSFDKKNAIEKMLDLNKIIVGIYNPLRDSVFDAFRNVYVNSYKIFFFNRKLKHWFWKNVGSYCEKSKTINNFFLDYLKTVFLINPVKHFYYSSEENKIFDLPKNEERAKQARAFFDCVVSENPHLKDFFKKGNQLSSEGAARIYHAYLGCIGAGVLLTANLFPAVAIFGFLGLEYVISNLNEEKNGQSTSLIGTIRDKMGWTKKYSSPFDEISGDYKLGLWRPGDLE